MENHFSRYSKIALAVLVFILSISLSLTTVYGQGLQGQSTLQERLAEKGIDLYQLRERIRQGKTVKDRYKNMLMAKPGVVGTGMAITAEGDPVIKVFTAEAGVGGIPASLDGVPVKTRVTGRFYALQDPPLARTDRWDRPVPIGVSTGHPDITAGTIGARVKDIAGNFYALSNNHVYADENHASVGDSVIQPGTYDGGSLPDDFIGTLAAYKDLEFGDDYICGEECFWIFCFPIYCSVENKIDAAIVDIVDPGTGDLLVGVATPSDGYGMPKADIHPAFGDPTYIGDEDLPSLYSQSVQKYGRTTGLTTGTITDWDAEVNVNYDSGTARFVNQIIVESSEAFIQGGDSGSLLVTNPGREPVGLLYAANQAGTFSLANRIDLVLNEFDVTIDGEGSLPYLAIDDVSVEEGNTATTVATFTVSLSAASEATVTVNYATADGTAISDNDYLATSGSVTFQPNEVTKEIYVTVNGDTTFEYDEYFYVNLTDPANALIADSQGIVTISNDDPQPPSLPEITIDDVSVPEGDSGTTEAIFTVSLSAVSDAPVTVDYATADGSATTADSDYSIVSGTLTFATNEVAKTITVSINGDEFAEDDETFKVNLTNVEGAVIVDSQGIGTIVNDDPPLSSSGPQLELVVTEARTDQWTTVSLANDYGNEMVLVCSPNYDRYATGPALVRVTNASGSSFEVGLGRPWYGSFGDENFSATVQCMVVREGVYNTTDHGVKLEAVKLTGFSQVDGSGSWVGTWQEYRNPDGYTNPVVVGQVVSPDTGSIPSNCPFSCEPDWSVFWSRGAKATSPPSNSNLYVGRHTGQDPNGRPPETLMYVVIEQGSGEMDGHNYVAGLGGNTIRGMGNNPPYTYDLLGLSSASMAIVSQAGMNNADGGWAVLYGPSPVSATELRLAIEEDWYLDTERRLRPRQWEQVGYIVFE